jgi:hypothetical protein
MPHTHFVRNAGIRFLIVVSLCESQDRPHGRKIFTEGGGGNKDLHLLSSEDLRYLRFLLLALIDYGSL